ncbi:MAG: PHP domain-containing protein [Clostridia bacterium]|nr:PHP domain-containing protein [Clostridia bacterium]
MKFCIDHDLHIHSHLSLCSHDDTQTPARILEYAKENGLKTICMTDHFWDESVPGASGWYQKQNYAHICEDLPLPTAEGIRFLFGAETDYDQFFTVGVSDEMFDKLDFVIIPTTHMHMDFVYPKENDSYERRAEQYVMRLDKLLDKDLPFHKIGIAHLTCSLLMNTEPGAHHKVLNMIPDSTYRELFTKIAKKGAGFELNFPALSYEGEALETELRPYRIAKACGCKFYLGSDAHKVKELENVPKRFERIVELLDLQEEEKFII